MGFAIRALVCGVLATTTAFAAETPREPLRVRDFTYGIELTATTDQNPEYDIGKPIHGQTIDFAERAARRFAELTGGEVLARTSLGEVPVRTSTGKWVFENDSGVLEVASPVLRLDQVAETDAIFKTFADVGLKPEVKAGGAEGGGGHIHIGRQVFDRNPLLLRNFIADLMNRPYVQGVLEEAGDDQALSLRDRGLDRALARELRKLDDRFARGEAVTTEEVARTVIRAFGDGTADGPVPQGDAIYSWPARYSDVNLTNLLTRLHPTIELRLMRAPRNTAEVIARARLFTRYLLELDAVSEPIEVKPMSAAEKAWSELPSVMRGQWEKFVGELGLDARTYLEQWKGRFPRLVGAGAELKGARRELEIREGRSLVEHKLVYELRFEGTRRPRAELALERGSALHPVFRELEPGVWLARVERPITAQETAPTELNLTFREGARVVARLSGTYRIGDGRLADDGQGARSEFTPADREAAERELRDETRRGPEGRPESEDRPERDLK